MSDRRARIRKAIGTRMLSISMAATVLLGAATASQADQFLFRYTGGGHGSLGSVEIPPTDPGTGLQSASN